MAPRFEESSSTITEETPSFQSVQSDSYPFTWTDLSDEEKKERKRIYTAEGPWCVSPKASMLVKHFTFTYIYDLFNLT
jgi:hypothetical protein